LKPKCIKEKCPWYQEIQQESMLGRTIHCPCMSFGRCSIITDLVNHTLTGSTLSSDAWEIAIRVYEEHQAMIKEGDRSG